MTDTKHHESEGKSFQGKVFRPQTSEERAEAVELAFDYRGDVTMRLRSGEVLAGYVFNRQVAGDDSYLELFPSLEAPPRRVPYREIQELAFSGEDTASGRSWESWVSKKESQRLTEQARVEADARARGHL